MLSLCFQDGGILNETVLITITSYHNAKKQEKEEKDKQKATKHQKTIDEAKELLEMEKDSSEYTVSKLKVLIQYKKQPGDSPLKSKKGDLVAQWDHHWNCQARS